MKNILLPAVLVLGIGFGVQAQDSRARTTTTTTTTSTATTVTGANSPNARLVRAAFDKVIDGIRRADVDLVTSVYQNSPNTLYFNNNGSVTRGWEQDKLNRESRYPDVTNVKLDVQGVRIEMLGSDGAVVTCAWTQTQDFKGTSESASGRMTLVFRRVGKDYKIIHAHTSPDRPDASRPVFPSERTTTDTTDTTTTRTTTTTRPTTNRTPQ